LRTLAIVRPLHYVKPHAARSGERFLIWRILVAGMHSVTNGEVIVAYMGENRIVDQAKIDEIGRNLEALFNKAEHGKLLINFDGVRFMGSAMLGKLISLNKKCKDAKVQLKLCTIDDQIMQVFKLTKLDKVLDIQPNEDRALASFEKKGGWFS
jgi:anti-sigma B factor antagonist